KRDCGPKGSIKELLVRKAHERGLKGNLREPKTLEMLHEHFFRPQIKRMYILYFPPFFETSDAERYLEWEMKVEQIFSFYYYSDKKVRVASLEYGGYGLV
ncbi:hypothetical protein CR513_44610, partial [Mucuna pruriens]